MQDIKIDRTIYTTKPDAINRLPVEMAVYDLLKKLEIPYLRMDHDKTAMVESCREIEKLLDIKVCKNLFLCDTQQSSFYLLMIPGDKKFKTKQISQQINSTRLSFANAEFMEKYLHIEPGSVSVLGLMNDAGQCVKLLVDREILSYEYIGCHPCVNTSSLKIKAEDLFTKFLPYINHPPVVVEM